MDMRKYLKNANKLFGVASSSTPKSRASVGGSTGRAVRTTLPRPKSQSLLSSSAVSTKVVSAKRVSAVTPKLPKNCVATSSSKKNQKRNISWQNYENIFRIKDDLRFQFPVLGYDRFCSVFIDLFDYFKSRDLLKYPVSATQGSHDSTFSDSSDFFVTRDLYVRLTFDELMRDFLFPAFGACIGTFDARSIRAVSVQGLTMVRSIRCNGSFGKLLSLVSSRRIADVSRTTVSSVDNETNEGIDDGYGGGFSDGENDDDSMVRRFGSQNSLHTGDNHSANYLDDNVSQVDKAHLVNYCKKIQQRYREFLENRFLHVDFSGSLFCDCCSYSLKILISYGDNDDGIDWNRVFKGYREPAIHFNTKLVLSWPVDEITFARDFVLKHDSSIDNKKSTSFLHKTVAVYNMGFFKRLYVIHVIVYFLVMFVWTKHRLVHTVTNLSGGGDDESSTVAPDFPVFLIVQKKLRPIFTEVKTLFFVKLCKTRKIFIQYV